MDKKNIQTILQEAMEVEIPPQEINLWPAVKANLVAGKQAVFQQGEKMNVSQPRRTSRIALIAFAVIALLTVAFLTPQGRTIAQNIIQFFTRSNGDSFPLQPSQIVAAEPDLAAPTAQPPSPLISVTEAEAQAGFTAAQLPSVPSGFNYLGARLYGDAISIEYEAGDGAGHLILMQSPHDFIQSEWDSTPAEAVVQVMIGEIAGEFVKGTFVVYPGETNGRWNPEASILRLRWVKDGISYELTKYGDVEAIAYLDQAGMIALAESLVTTP